MQGTEKKAEATITITNGVSSFAFVDDLEQGEYTIVEQNVPTDVTVNNNQTVTVVAGKTNTDTDVPFVTFNNDKTVASATGSLKIKKNVTVNGAATTGTEADGTYKFDVTGPNGYATQVEISITNGESNVAEVSNLPEGTYTITEQQPSNGTSLTSANNVQVTVDSTLTGDAIPVAEFTNNKTIVTGDVQIKKAVNFTGDAAADADTKEFTVTVTVKDSTDAVDTTVNGTFGDVTFTDGVATIIIKNGETKNITGLKKGLKVVAEEADASGAFEGYDYDGDSTTNGNATVDDQTMGEIILVNKYTKRSTPVGQISVTKTVNNPDGVEGVDGKVFKIALKDGDNYVQDLTTGATGPDVKYFNIKDNETLTFQNLTADHEYTVVEDVEDAKIYGADLTVTGSNVTVTATTAGTAHGVTNSYKKLCKIEISKVQMYGTTGIIGAILQMIKVDDTGAETVIETWESKVDTKKFALEDGSYIIREKEAPKGYIKSLEDIKFIVVDGEISETNFNGGSHGKFTKATGLIEFKNDPIATGKLSIHITEADTGKDVPGAEIEVTGPFDGPGTKVTKKFITNEKGEIVDEKGNTPIVVPAGKYTFKVTKIPEGYKIISEDTGEVVVPENKEGRAEKKIIPTGGLEIIVRDEVSKKPVPGAKVEITKPDGTVEIRETDENGKIKGYEQTEIGKYKVKVIEVPKGFVVTVNEEQEAEVKKKETTTVISEINKDTGGLIITVIDQKTGKPVPNALIEITKPDGSKEQVRTDENGQIKKYAEKDGDGRYKSETGEYKIKVIEVPDGFSVIEGEETKIKVEPGKVKEHIAKIIPKEDKKEDEKKDEKKDDKKNDVPQQEEKNDSESRIVNPGRRTTTGNISARTGESNVPYVVFGGSMATLIAGAVLYVLLAKKKREKDSAQ